MFSLFSSWIRAVRLTERWLLGAEKKHLFIFRFFILILKHSTRQTNRSMNSFTLLSTPAWLKRHLDYLDSTYSDNDPQLFNQSYRPSCKGASWWSSRSRRCPAAGIWAFELHGGSHVGSSWEHPTQYASQLRNASGCDTAQFGLKCPTRVRG